LILIFTVYASPNEVERLEKKIDFQARSIEDLKSEVANLNTLLIKYINKCDEMSLALAGSSKTPVKNDVIQTKPMSPSFKEALATAKAIIARDARKKKDEETRNEAYLQKQLLIQNPDAVEWVDTKKTTTKKKLSTGSNLKRMLLSDDSVTSPGKKKKVLDITDVDNDESQNMLEEASKIFDLGKDEFQIEKSKPDANLDQNPFREKKKDSKDAPQVITDEL